MIATRPIGRLSSLSIAKIRTQRFYLIIIYLRSLRLGEKVSFQGLYLAKQLFWRHALLPELLKADGILKTRFAQIVQIPVSSAFPVLRLYDAEKQHWYEKYGIMGS